MTTADSVFKDTGLTPAAEYHYRVSILQNDAITHTSNLLQVRTMDTTRLDTGSTVKQSSFSRQKNARCRFSKVSF